MFPLGGLTKPQVRALARKFALNTAEKPESQDICFVPAGGYKKFIEDRVGPKAMTPGPFVDEKGQVIGQHKGLANYTIGQRDKLGLALGYPVYVYKMDRATNTVHIGNLRAAIFRRVEGQRCELGEYGNSSRNHRSQR